MKIEPLVFKCLSANLGWDFSRLQGDMDIQFPLILTAIGHLNPLGSFEKSQPYLPKFRHPSLKLLAQNILFLLLFPEPSMASFLLVSHHTILHADYLRCPFKTV